MTATTNDATTQYAVGWLTIPQAVEYTGMSSTTIRAAINNKAYPYPLNARRPGAGGKVIRIKRAELDAWMDAHGDGATATT